MKKYKILVLTFFIIIIFSCVLAPIKKIPLDIMVGKVDFVAETVDYKDGVYNFGKVMRRILMLTALLVFLILRKSLNTGTLFIAGIKIRAGWCRQFFLGFSLACGSLLIYYFIALLFGVSMIHLDFHSTGIILSKLFNYLLIGCLIGFIEEAFFRGFVLKAFMEDMSLPTCRMYQQYDLLHASLFPG